MCWSGKVCYFTVKHTLMYHTHTHTHTHTHKPPPFLPCESLIVKSVLSVLITDYVPLCPCYPSSSVSLFPIFLNGWRSPTSTFLLSSCFPAVGFSPWPYLTHIAMNSEEKHLLLIFFYIMENVMEKFEFHTIYETWKIPQNHSEIFMRNNCRIVTAPTYPSLALSLSVSLSLRLSLIKDELDVSSKWIMFCLNEITRLGGKLSMSIIVHQHSS